MDLPPLEVIDAIESGTTTIVRSAKIYEADARSLWVPEGGTQEPVLIDGSVTVDANRQERRFLDNLVISNNDGQIRVGVNGLWYNHVIKVRKGIRYSVPKISPSIAIVEAHDLDTAYAYKQMLTNMGFGRTDIKLDVVSYGELSSYDIVASFMDAWGCTKTSLLTQAYMSGKGVITQGNDNTEASVPLIATSTSGTVTWGIYPVAGDTPLSGGWSTEAYGSDTGYKPATLRPGVVAVAALSASDSTPTAIVEENGNGGRWFHFQSHTFGTQGKILLSKAISWLQNYSSTKEWTTQVGEFMIDKLNEDNFPGTISISGRDFTKKCLNSKLERSESFPAGTKVEALIRALAANSGIWRFTFPGVDIALPTSMEIERGTDRWTVMSAAAASINHQLYFNSYGSLTLEPYSDPTTSPVTAIFQTGENGNLASLQKTVHDGNLFNHIVVTSSNESQSGAAVALPYFGEAKNDKADSPTSIQQIGDRYYQYESTFLTSDEQCQELAKSLLKIYALESFELNWSSFSYPWMEVGRVVRILDPKRIQTDPTRYLLDTLNIPLGLGPMSGTGKRVTIVNPAA